MRPGGSPGSIPPWGYVGAQLAQGWGASCGVARGVSGVLRVGVVPVLPVSVRRRLRGGEGVCVHGVGLWVMSHRRLPFFPRLLEGLS